MKTFILLTATSIFLASSCMAQCPAKLPNPVNDFRATNPGWSILDLNDLANDDQALWRQYRSGLCPGLATGHFNSKTVDSYVVALIRTEGNNHYSEKVVLLSPSTKGFTQTTVIKASPTDVLGVIWKAPPGKSVSFYNRKEIYVPVDSFIFEHLEASATQYYVLNGKLRSILTSD